MQRFAWLSDTHMNLSAFPFMKRLHLLGVRWGSPDGIFITGDISSGQWLESDLRFLARNFPGPIYFVLGNHDYHGRHIASVHDDVRRLSHEYPNLIWMTEAGVVSLNEDVALIGTEGWYDASLGDPDLLRWTTDWFLTFDFLHLKNHQHRIEMWREMSDRSAALIESRLREALETHKTVYVITHVPPWKEATRAMGTLMEPFWLPYNTNSAMGQAIERVVDGRRKKRVVVLAGHTHTPCRIRVTNSIECAVARSTYWGSVSPEEMIVV